MRTPVGTGGAQGVSKPSVRVVTAFDDVEAERQSGHCLRRRPRLLSTRHLGSEEIQTVSHDHRFHEQKTDFALLAVPEHCADALVRALRGSPSIKAVWPQRQLQLPPRPEMQEPGYALCTPPVLCASWASVGGCVFGGRGGGGRTVSCRGGAEC